MTYELGVEASQRRFRETRSTFADHTIELRSTWPLISFAMFNPTLMLPGLSPVAGRSVVAKFDGGLLSSDGGLLLFREAEHGLR